MTNIDLELIRASERRLSYDMWRGWMGVYGDLTNVYRTSAKPAAGIGPASRQKDDQPHN